MRPVGPGAGRVQQQGPGRVNRLQQHVAPVAVLLGLAPRDRAGPVAPRRQDRQGADDGQAQLDRDIVGGIHLVASATRGRRCRERPPKNEPKVTMPIIMYRFLSSRTSGGTASSMGRIRGGASSSTLSASTSWATLVAAISICAISSLFDWRSSVSVVSEWLTTLIDLISLLELLLQFGQHRQLAARARPLRPHPRRRPGAGPCGSPRGVPPRAAAPATARASFTALASRLDKGSFAGLRETRGARPPRCRAAAAARRAGRPPQATAGCCSTSWSISRSERGSGSAAGSPASPARCSLSWTSSFRFCDWTPCNSVWR